ncbi:hypothetical protein [Pelagicoccus sp. SDUM812002]|uniref:hypothetical protein n=1 Tax=Pelagicoccus sp. SDUM812002 TaxID=3041266 RepID=UPI00280FD7E7|nr:hypothetical protein [Pelagicoccus sp. SDUM812002]MDQ8187404.1 hypothetical protein [Pelagicoccus sp. SDUM812002]
MNASTTADSGYDIKERNHSQTEGKTTSDWLAERKSELREVLEEKSKALSRKAQDSLSEKLGNYHSAVRKASESLEEDSETQTAKITANIAQQIRESADYIQNTSPEMIVGQATDRVRKAPMLALGVAAIAGFLAGRVIMSAKDDTPPSS